LSGEWPLYGAHGELQTQRHRSRSVSRSSSLI
jgi:hypothetical protein